MKNFLILLAACSLVLLLAVVVNGNANQVVFTPSAKQVRFQLIGNEPIAAPDDQGLVGGWSVLVFKDRKAGDCYVAFSRGDSIATAQARTCPAPD